LVPTIELYKTDNRVVHTLYVAYRCWTQVKVRDAESFSHNNPRR